ncbi:MAG: SRPBCC family protein [Desulfuromonadaceae bacterium]|nr:SRPBCC family protein [Desulfuromonadaceae bacterium]
MNEYQFLTTWRVTAPLDQVWEAIYHSENWPKWWPGLLRVVELERGDGNGIGNLRRYSWRGMLPYRLVFDIRTTRIERPYLLAGTASGDLAGVGVWHFCEENGGVVVQYEWLVSTQKKWMNILTPLARPLFRWNHDQVMRRGKAGLTRYLENHQTKSGQA